MQCADYAGPDAALRAALEKAGITEPKLGAIAVAGPVTGDEIQLTNRDWCFSQEGLRRSLGLGRLIVINDLAALAHALPHLDAKEFDAFGGGQGDPHAPRAVVAPGTGLGVSCLVKSDAEWVAVAGEGGHVDFAPANEREVEILRWFWKRNGHVSIETLLSGSGLVDLYAALCEIDGLPQHAEHLSASSISRLAREGTDAAARATVVLFSQVLGGISGNAVLNFGARGGVYLAGGVIQGLGTAFDRQAFRARFEDKGRFRAFLEPIPSSIVRARHPALVGLAKLLASP
jgi:glucokinase